MKYLKNVHRWLIGIVVLFTFSCTQFDDRSINTNEKIDFVWVATVYDSENISTVKEILKRVGVQPSFEGSSAWGVSVLVKRKNVELAVTALKAASELKGGRITIVEHELD